MVVAVCRNRAMREPTPAKKAQPAVGKEVRHPHSIESYNVTTRPYATTRTTPCSVYVLQYALATMSSASCICRDQHEYTFEIVRGHQEPATRTQRPHNTAKHCSSVVDPHPGLLQETDVKVDVVHTCRQRERMREPPVHSHASLATYSACQRWGRLHRDVTRRDMAMTTTHE
jgi:hypothetical protein